MRAVAVAFAVVGLVVVSPLGAGAGERKVRMPTEQEIQKMQEAAPDKAPAKPAKPRKLLVWGHMWTHDPNPFAAKAFEILGRKSGAFEAVVTDDPAALLAENLKEFDTVVMNNIHEPEPFLPANLKDLPEEQQAAATKQREAIRESLLEFVGNGKGLVGVHAATAALQNWKEYGEMIGGYYGGHITQNVPIKLDEPDHPINACFKGKGFQIHDEIYIFRGPHSRKTLRVILSLDLSQMEDPKKREDKDYAITWVRPYGKGRVFYCSLGHMSQTYWNPLFLRHVLAGTQFALGDLKADAAPKQ